MNQKVKDYVTGKVKELMEAPSCCADARALAQNWLDALGTNREMEQTKNLIAELEEDIMPIDGLIAFTSSEAGMQIFGKEQAEKMLEHAKAIKASNAKYCDCPACIAAKAILEKKAELV